MSTGSTTVLLFKLISVSRRLRPHAYAQVSTQERAIDKGGTMGSFDREQLEALKRQIEEDYRLDIAAIERLQRRFISQGQTSSGSKDALPVERDRNVTVLSTLESQSEAQPDELTNTLRGMFSSHRR